MSPGDQEGNIDIIYSLPAITHSVAIANRTPAARFTQKSKYMPDYGGIIETPESALKKNDLTSTLPFKSNSSRFRELILKREIQLTKAIQPQNDCLVVVPSDYGDYFIVITAYDNSLYIDSVVINNNDNYHDTNLILLKQFSEKIIGIKLLQKFLAIKFLMTVKLLDLDMLLKEVESNVTNLNTYSCITERVGFCIKDTCINKYNKSIHTIASDHSCSGQVKLYDLSSKQAAKQAFLTISWDSEEDNSYVVNEDESNTIHRTLRGRSIRQFIPSRPAIRGIQQLDCIPSHLVNMIVTTDYKTSLIDPRMNQLGQVYVDKTSIPSFYPIEYLRRTVFSNNNGYQFYSLSNVHIRVFDTRYPGLPMNQLNHMLDSERQDSLQCKLINYKTSSLETICCSSDSRISFITFDQAGSSNLINPKSIHLPYHDDGDDFIDQQVSPFESREMYLLTGLDVRCNLDDSDILFSTLQLLNNGNILMRDFTQPQNDRSVGNNNSEERAKFIIDHTRKKFASFRSNNFQYSYNNNLDERDIINFEDNCELDSPYINILDSTPLLSIEDSFKSLRARERFLKMKASFCR